jgi:hypothetical protein
MCYAQSATRLRKRSVAESGSQHSHRERCEIPGILAMSSMDEQESLEIVTSIQEFIIP